MNKNQIEGNWEQLKGKAKQKWALLGDKDFQLYLEGKTQEFAGRIQEVYGKSQSESEADLKDFEKNCGCSSSNQAA